MSSGRQIKRPPVGDGGRGASGADALLQSRHHHVHVCRPSDVHQIDGWLDGGMEEGKDPAATNTLTRGSKIQTHCYYCVTVQAVEFLCCWSVGHSDRVLHLLWASDVSWAANRWR